MVEAGHLGGAAAGHLAVALSADIGSGRPSSPCCNPSV